MIDLFQVLIGTVICSFVFPALAGLVADLIYPSRSIFPELIEAQLDRINMAESAKGDECKT